MVKDRGTVEQNIAEKNFLGTVHHGRTFAWTLLAGSTLSLANKNSNNLMGELRDIPCL